MTIRILVTVIALVVATLIGVVYAGLRRHQGARWSDCLVDGAKCFGSTVGLALVVVAFVWVTNATADGTGLPDGAPCPARAAEVNG